MPRRLRTITSRRRPRSSDTRIGTRRSGLATYRSRNRSYVCNWPGFRRVTRLKSSSMSFWTGFAVRSSMYLFESPATKRQFRLKRFLSRWASSSLDRLAEADLVGEDRPTPQVAQDPERCALLVIVPRDAVQDRPREEAVESVHEGDPVGLAVQAPRAGSVPGRPERAGEEVP